MYIKRGIKIILFTIVVAILISSLSWIGKQDLKEAERKQVRMDRYEIMIKNAMQGNQEKNREFLEGGYYE